MKTAEQYLNGYKRLLDSNYWVTAEDFKTAINILKNGYVST
jgi:hypothetical protein